MKSLLFTAICTPLNEDHTLHRPGLEAHIEDQWRYGIAGLLVAGTMGLLQLQSDATYIDLVHDSVMISKNRGEILVGVGDTCFGRTRDRIQMVEHFAIDGVVVLSPYLIKFSQVELVDYFLTLADVSSKPIYLYDLPQLTGTKLEPETVTALVKHSNIRGIKCSGTWEETRQLLDLVGDKFRIIPAQPHLVDQLIRVGVRENLDGVFGIAPHWATEIARLAEAKDWLASAQCQKRLSQLLRLLRNKYTVFGGCEAILNARGIPGRLAPAPMQRLNDQKRDELLSEQLVRKLVAESAES